MISRSLTILSCTGIIAAAAGETGFYQFRSFQPAPGQTLVIKTRSESLNGEIIATQGAETRKGTLSITNQKTLERTVSGADAKAKLQYRTLASLRSTTTRFGETETTDSSSGPLLGITVEGMRDQTRQWRLFTENNSNDPKIAAAVSELEAYENRRLFLDQPVRTGQSWPIDPGFVRHLIERDLGKSPIKASMTFRSVEPVDGEPTALFDFSIESVGAKQEQDDKKRSAASVSLTGTLQVDLKTMLDRKTTLTGSLTSMVVTDDQSTSVTLPIHMTITRSLR